jgi:hypothetical protein
MFFHQGAKFIYTYIYYIYLQVYIYIRDTYVYRVGRSIVDCFLNPFTAAIGGCEQKDQQRLY